MRIGLVPQRRADFGQQGAGAERLGDERHAVRLHGKPCAGHRVAGHEEHAPGQATFTHPARQGHPVLARHPHIGEQQVDRPVECLALGYGVSGSGGAHGAVTGRLEDAHREVTHGRVVINDQIVMGDEISREIFHNEKAKFAAVEMLPHTHGHVAETVGGILVNGKVRYGVHVPDFASLLAGFSPSTKIRGRDAIPPPVRPAGRLVDVVHLSFDAMVGLSFLLLALVGWFALTWWRHRDLPRSRWFLRGAAVSGVLAVITLEAGWVVTDAGRQPWTVVGLLLTRDAVTTAGNVWLFFTGAVVIYTAMGVGAVLVLRQMRRRWAELGAS